jgi:ubiquinone/menaquinone biosynthesis C-methylase UbiE
MDKTKLAIDVFNKNAKAYQDKFMDVELYNSSIDLFCKSIKNENANILDIACGPGNITHYLLQKCPNFTILGIDLSENMLALAKNNCPNATFQLMDCRDIGAINQKFDAIFCGFCLPYLSKKEAIKLIKDASKLLNPNGVFYLSTMEKGDNISGFKTSNSGDTLFMYYHQADYLIDALYENNFKLIDVIRQDYPTKEGVKTTDLLIIVEKII